MKRDAVGNKKKLLKALENSLGIVTPACRAVKLNRKTFYSYYNNDPEFKLAVDELNSLTMDYVEDRLFDKIREGSEKSIQFYLKYKGKLRGYNDSLDVTTNGNDINSIKIIEITKTKDEDDEDKLKD
jgi:hypothetical protein